MPAAHNQTNATALVIDCDELTINLLFFILQESVGSVLIEFYSGTEFFKVARIHSDRVCLLV